MQRYLSFLIALILTSSIVLFSCNKPAVTPPSTPSTPSASSAQTGPIKIGVVYPLTGPIAMTGKKMVDAVKFAFEQVGGTVAGRKVEIIADDSGEPNPAIVIDKVRKLIENDKVNLLIGPLTVPGKMSVGEYMAKAGIPHLATHFNLPEMSNFPWSIMAGGSTHQECGTMGLYAFKEQNIKTATGITFETGDGRAFLNAFKQGFEKAGGKLIQEQYTVRPCSDFSPYFTALQDADGAAVWVDGADAILFLTQYDEFGIKKKMPLVPIFHGSFVEPFILNVLPPKAAEAMLGVPCPTTYSPDIDTEVNKRFVKDIQTKFGYIPEEADAGAYLAAQIAIKALESTAGETTPKKLLDSIITLKVETPEGPMSFDPQTRFAIRDVYIVKIVKAGDNYGWNIIKTYNKVPPAGL